jgi:5'-nucleotidase
MTPKLNLLFDLDGVLANWTKGIRDGLTYDLQKHIDESSWSLTGPDAPEGFGSLIKNRQASHSFYRYLSPIDGAVEAVRALSVHHDVTFCSTPDHTNKTCASDKINWVEEHFGEGWGKRLILTHDKTAIRGDFLIDDKPDITGAHTPAWKQIVFDQPYNRTPNTHGMPRLRSWSEFDVADALAVAVYA